MQVRPTLSKVRQAAFNMIPLGRRMHRFLDLYSGTGIVGLEALSRGAEEAIFIDSARSSLDLVAKNADSLNLSQQSKWIRADLPAGLNTLSSMKGYFDLIFMDPPYGMALAEPTLCSIDRQQLLAKDGWVIVQTESKLNLPRQVGELVQIKHKQYGDSDLYVYEKSSLEKSA